MKKYLRFKDIPENEISNIYRGDSGKIGEEMGVSCIELTKNNIPIIPFKITGSNLKYNKGIISFLHDFSWLLDDFLSGIITAYIITGDEAGKGSDGEPLLKNVKIITKLDSKAMYKIEKNDTCENEIVLKTEISREWIIDNLKKIQLSAIIEKDDGDLYEIFKLIEKL